MFKIRLIAQYYDGDRPTVDDQYLLSEEISSLEADALLCNWAPNEELLTFAGPKAWYCCEATSYHNFNKPFWQQVKDSLAEHEFLYHAHPNPAYRVPHVTHVGSLRMSHNTDRRSRAIAVVTRNSAQRGYALSEALARRNAYILHPLVDLYGKRDSWKRYMKQHGDTRVYDRFFGYSRFLGLYRRRFLTLLNRVLFQPVQPPPNYKGEVPGKWLHQNITDLLSQYKVNICMENTLEPYYFTEKFVNAAMAGCIPVYAAHPAVAEVFLQGAMWVDPADFDYDVTETLKFALAQDRERYAEANFAWLQTGQVRRTEHYTVYRRICEVLEGMAT